MMKQSTFVIEDEESLKQWIEKDHMLLIFDVHLNWSGSCEVLRPCFDQTYIQHERAEDRFAFLTMEGPRFADSFESMVTFSENCRMTLDDLVPLKKLDSKDDASSNFRERMKSLLCKDEKGCSPLFLAVKSRKIISIVLGASYPALSKILNEQMPPLSDEEKAAS